MKLLGSILCLTFTLAAAPSDPIRTVGIDPLKIVRVPVSADNLTTIQFPSPISDIEGAFISSDGEPPSKFQISFRPGSHFFSLRALSTNAAATVNVVWKGKIYIFDLTESLDPVLSMIMAEQASANSPPIRKSLGTTPARLQEIVRIARLYPSIQTTNPELLKGIERVSPNRTVNHTHFESTLEEVFGFASDDTLVFHVSFTNKTSSPIVYLPKTLTAKTGNRLFLQSLVDADGVIGTNVPSVAYFAITGGVMGTPERVSITNQFEALFETLPLAANVLPSLQPRVSPTTASTPTNAAAFVPASPVPLPLARPASVAVTPAVTNVAKAVTAGPVSIAEQLTNSSATLLTNQITIPPVATPAPIADPARVLTVSAVSTAAVITNPPSTILTNRLTPPPVIAAKPITAVPLVATLASVATSRPVSKAQPNPRTVTVKNPPQRIILIAQQPATSALRMSPAPIVYEQEEDYVERKPWWHFSRWPLIRVNYSE